MKKSEMLAAKKRIRESRQRSHILKKVEFKTIDYLCEKMPVWISPDMLTVTGIIGSVIVGLGLVLAVYSPLWLLLSIMGLFIQWFGDSLDGRIAYYRNTPRKWYGWSLDINADWISISVMSLGFYFYLPHFKIIAILLAMAYGGALVLSLLKYKLTDKYVIDKGLVGPTEMRVFIALALLFELFIPGVLAWFAFIASMLIMLGNVKDSIDVSRAGDQRDIEEKKFRTSLENAA